MHVPNLHSPEEDTFAIISDLVPTGDQPQAIDELTAGLLRGEKYQTLLGATGLEKLSRLQMLSLKYSGRPLFSHIIRH